jgi:hypothetical protein
MTRMLFLFTLCILTYVRLTTHVTFGCSDGDENIVFDEDEEQDEGFLLAGQGIPRCNYLTLRFHFNQHIAPLTYAKYYQRMMMIPS